jgi:hypothetical protein
MTSRYVTSQCRYVICNCWCKFTHDARGIEMSDVVANYKYTLTANIVIRLDATLIACDGGYVRMQDLSMRMGPDTALQHSDHIGNHTVFQNCNKYVHVYVSSYNVITI